MKHLIYPVAFLALAFVTACSGDKKGTDENSNANPHPEEQVAPAPTQTENPDKQEIEEYRTKVDVVLNEIDAKIEQNKEMKKNEKDKNKKEAYDASIDYLQKLKDELKDKKDKFDDRSTNAWQEFKMELDDIFKRSNEDRHNSMTK